MFRNWIKSHKRQMTRICRRVLSGLGVDEIGPPFGTTNTLMVSVMVSRNTRHSQKCFPICGHISKRNRLRQTMS
ncbi:unnamed protein product [Oppiella nova]|uniref:Uncharacterized protein n=1 Tax=Oppiella nova TaxID=334625 RepID=A0A7R9MDS7_9ACAR|nr:unnamed protein product [Oppiella nova]CAG2175353.1 unnamed protein product [Oppiella nova]